jgi:hypothetical protein
MKRDQDIKQREKDADFRDLVFASDVDRPSFRDLFPELLESEDIKLDDQIVQSEEFEWIVPTTEDEARELLESFGLDQ